MHIPDGILDLWIALLLFGLSALYAIHAFNKARESLNEQLIPRLAVFTAMVFAFQMLNFPIAGGTSGHLLGYVLLAILLGPELAFIGIMLVLFIQALIFGDGGLLALGANIFNMGIVAMSGYFIYKYSVRKSTNKRLHVFASFVGGYASVVIASVAAGIEIGVSTAFPFGVGVTIPAMLTWHLLIGIGEGAITSGIIAWVLKSHPEFIFDAKKIVEKELVVINSEQEG
ncbi:MAG: energy-coupling factor ABC transporter permease [Promethearchaeota archaeon]